jgi:hypothetical protein
MIMTRRILAGHVASMGRRAAAAAEIIKTYNAHKSLFGESEGNIPLGRLICKWNNNTKLNSKRNRREW